MIKQFTLGMAATAISASAGFAGGLERTTESAMILYADGNRVELSYAYVDPSLTGHEAFMATPTGPFIENDISDVADGYSLPGFAFKYDLNDKVALALTYERPWGANILYGPESALFGGTSVEANTSAITALAKYQFTDNISVFGGVRMQEASGDVLLQGAAYQSLSGYRVTLDSNWAVGYVLGAAYEIPDIALRVALTYNSEITHDFATTEYVPGAPGPIESTTTTKTPKSVNLEFQTGVSQSTLLMGSIRWAEHSAFRIDPLTYTSYNPDGLVNLDDTWTFNLGLGHRFTPKLSASVMLGYEAEGDKLGSALAPSTGKYSVTVGANYKVTDSMDITAGISQIWVGDAYASTPAVEFADNTATAFGIKLGYSF